MISEWFANHQESARIAPKQFQTHLQITKNHQESLRITENHPKMISEWFENHWESPRIAPKQFQTDSRITKNHRELPQKWFHSGSRITENHWESLRIAPKQFSILQIVHFVSRKTLNSYWSARFPCKPGFVCFYVNVTLTSNVIWGFILYYVINSNTDDFLLTFWFVNNTEGTWNAFYY